jgi:hypothetical protein
MSKNEEELAMALTNNGIIFIPQQSIPFPCPWMTGLSRSNPKVDFYIPAMDLYIEVKGFMTIEAMAKMAFISRQNIRYYIYQCTESEWDPLIENNCARKINNATNISAKLKQNKCNQINEICNVDRNYFDNISDITYHRLQNFISKKMVQYISWVGKWC